MFTIFDVNKYILLEQTNYIHNSTRYQNIPIQELNKWAQCSLYYMSIKLSNACSSCYSHPPSMLVLNHSPSFINIYGFEVLKAVDNLHCGFLHYDTVLCVRCVSFQNDPRKIVEAGFLLKVWKQLPVSFHRGPAGEPGRGLIYQGLLSYGLKGL
jgi:hypothetical protein